MEKKWQDCKKILIIRPDNMGDILMSAPAIQALKTSINCHLTLLTSSMGKPIAPFIPVIDDIIVFDFPWVKNNIEKLNGDFNDTVQKIKKKGFDAAVIFTVYSQNPLPAAMLAFLADIPLRLSYCRENPYGLLTDWLPDKEPFSFILHQVKRDLNLVEHIGAKANTDNLFLNVNDSYWHQLQIKLSHLGIDFSKKWIIAHAGVSEEKRLYPNGDWIALSKKIIADLNIQVLFTGASSEIELAEALASETGSGGFSLAGKLNIEDFILLIKNAPLVISVNTVTMHIAAATKTPIMALYAFTNPQHFPWKAKGKVFPYQVSEQLANKNEIIKYVNEHLHQAIPKRQMPEEIFKTVYEVLILNKIDTIPEMPHLRNQ